MLMSKLGAAATKTASSVASRMKSVASGAGELKKKKKLVPGTAYKIAKPASKAANKLKNMAASCQACSGK